MALRRSSRKAAPKHLPFTFSQGTHEKCRYYAYSADELNDLVGEQSQHQRRRQADSSSPAHAGRPGTRAVFALTQVHRLHDSPIVWDGNHAVDDHDEREPRQPFRDSGLEQVELPEEAGVGGRPMRLSMNTASVNANKGERRLKPRKSAISSAG